MHSSPKYSYRVPIIRDTAGYTGRPEFTEHIRVQAANATHAQLAARLVTGAAVALEPERLGEVLPAGSADHYLLRGDA